MKGKTADIIKLHAPVRVPGDDNIVASIEAISPETASAWLKCNRLNRPVRRNHVAFLSREMTEGLWQVNGQAIVISDNEDVLDGQHRLLSVIDSGVTIRSLVVYGVPKEAFKTIDTGAIRTGADALSVWYPGRPPMAVKAVGSAVAWCLAFERGVIKHRDRLANAEVIEYVAKHKALWHCAERLLGYPREGRLIGVSVGTALYDAFARKDPDDAAEFMLGLYGGEPVDSGTAVYVLRNLLEKDQKRLAGRYPATVKARMTIKAWNLMRIGRDKTAAPSMIAVNSKDAERFTIR